MEIINGLSPRHNLHILSFQKGGAAPFYHNKWQTWAPPANTPPANHTQVQASFHWLTTADGALPFPPPLSGTARWQLEINTAGVLTPWKSANLQTRALFCPLREAINSQQDTTKFRSLLSLTWATAIIPAYFLRFRPCLPESFSQNGRPQWFF